MKKGFDSETYLKVQTEKIEERIEMFDKLYLEFGGKIFDDYHAARVLPGFKPDAKIRLLEKYWQDSRSFASICIFLFLNPNKRTV